MASETIKFSLSLRPPANSSSRRESSPEFLKVSSKAPILSSSRLCLERKSLRIRDRFCAIGGKIGVLNDRIEKGSSQEELDDSPVVVDLDPICSESQFDQIIGEPVIIVWEANWCRKCIYLKPKLQKLAAEYYPRLRFYCVNVNNVPHKLVARAGVTKMPTIQLWRDGKKQAELLGGHKAYLVVNEIREMIENDHST